MKKLTRKNIRMRNDAWAVLNREASKRNENPAVVLEQLILQHIDDLGDLTNGKGKECKQQD